MNSPKRVIRLGRLILVLFPKKSDAVTLEKELGDCRLHQEDPDEFRRRYMEKYGAMEGDVTLE